MTTFAERFCKDPFPWDVPRAPTIVRDPELAAVLAELQRVRGIMERVEEKIDLDRIIKLNAINPCNDVVFRNQHRPYIPPQTKTARTPWWKFWRDGLMEEIKHLKAVFGR